LVSDTATPELLNSVSLRVPRILFRIILDIVIGRGSVLSP
jgi:hypothetical protein